MNKRIEHLIVPIASPDISEIVNSFIRTNELDIISMHTEVHNYQLIFIFLVADNSKFRLEDKIGKTYHIE